MRVAFPTTATVRLLALVVVCACLSSRQLSAAGPARGVGFDGQDDSISASIPAALGSNYTVGAWVYLCVGGSNFDRAAVLSGEGVAGCGTTAELLIRSGNETPAGPQFLEFGRCGSFNGVPSTQPVPLRKWTHVAVTVSSNKLVSYYINGIAAGSWDARNFPTALNSSFVLGYNRVDGPSFNGLLGEVQVWKAQLNAAQLQASMQRNFTATRTNLVLSYLFTEARGTTVSNSAPSGALFNGTLRNGAERFVANAAPAAPVAVSGSAANIDRTMVTLSGTVTPNGAPTTVWFEWGLGGEIRNTLPLVMATAGAERIEYRFRGLLPGSNYSFRIMARNCLGITAGATKTFTTARGSATEFLVTTTADDGPGSLRDAILGTARQWGAVTNMVRFAPALAGKTILITNGSVTVERNVRVDASSLTGGIRLDARRRNRFFNVNPGAALQLDSLELVDGSDADGSGGAISSRGRLELNRCRLYRNGSYVGGALRLERGDTILTDCSLSTNSGYAGGAIWVGEASLKMVRCSLLGNSAKDGGAIVLGRFSAQIEDCTFAGNSALSGGAILANEGSLVMLRSRLTRNNASNIGGALSGSAISLAITNSTFDANSAQNEGGAVWLSGKTAPMSLTSCTVAANSARSSGGGIRLIAGFLSLNHCTITANHGTVSALREVGVNGGGIAVASEEAVELSASHSIVAGNANGDIVGLPGNQLGAAGDDAGGGVAVSFVFFSRGYNLVGIGDGTFAFNQPGDVRGVTNPRLAPLGDHGGPLPTCPPVAASRAINGGDPDFSGPPFLDQRGRARINDRRLDIGATESVFPALRAYYTFDDSSAIDLTGNTTVSTAGVSTPAWQSGQNGRRESAAAIPRGSDSSYLIRAAANPNDANLALGLKDSFTLSVWIRPEDISRDRWVIANDGPGGEGTLHFGLRGGRPYLGFWDNDLGGPTSIPVDRWTHLACTYERQGGLMALYVNGRLDNSTYDRPNTLGFHNLRIGWMEAPGAGDSRFQGRIDDLAIFGQALSASQVAALAAGAVRPDEQLPSSQLPLMVPQGCVWNVREIYNHPRTLDSVVDAEYVTQTAELGTLIDYQTDQINFSDPEGPGVGGPVGGARPFRSNNLTPNGRVNGDDNYFVLAARTQLVIAEEDDYTFGFTSDDGARLRIRNAVFKSSTRLAADNPANPAHRGDTLSFPGPSGNSATLGVAHLAPGVYDVEFLSWEIAGGAYCQVLFARGDRTSFTPAQLRISNTGVDANGVALGAGVADPHYTRVVNPNSAPTRAYALSPAAGWVSGSGVSQWIGTRSDSNHSDPGTHVYRTTFDLTGYDPATVRIGGRWAVDDEGTALKVNGVAVNIPGASYSAFQNFSLTATNARFVRGTNVIEFTTHNTGGPGGLRVEFSEFSAEPERLLPLGYTGSMELAVEVTPLFQRITNGAPLRTVQFRVKPPAGFGRTTYQWFFGDQPAAAPNIAGAQTDTLFINNATAANAGMYWVQVRNDLGEARVPCHLLNFTNGVSDRLAPVLTVTSPAPAFVRTTTDHVRLGGTMSDASGAPLVYLAVNGGPFTFFRMGAEPWDALQPLEPGTNVFRFSAVDLTGNTAPVVTRTVVRVVTNQISLAVTGSGTVVPNLHGQFLEVGRPYFLRATPAPGFVFSHWTGDVTCSGPALNFVMTPGLALRANFVTNPFTVRAGSYNGLVHEVADIRFDRSGFASFTLTPAGAYSGSLTLGALKLPLSGQFTLEGTATNRLARPGANALSLELSLDPNTPTQVHGRLGDNNWTAYLIADLAPVLPAGQRSPLAGSYTFGWSPVSKTEGTRLNVRGPGDNNQVLPGGDPVGAITVAANGQATVLTTLSDGTTGTQTIPVSRAGTLPFYQSLYGGKGAALGWFNLRKGAPVSGAVHGPVYWVRPRNAGPGLFTNGFEITAETFGSIYVAPTNNRVLAFTNGDIKFVLNSGTFLNQIILGPGGTVLNTSRNAMSVNLTRANGLFSGTARDPNSGRSLQFKGALFQDGNNGSGWILATNTSGPCYLFEAVP